MSRIMIFAEAVTLAHIGRPIALSRVLRSLGHEVCIAAAPAADRWLFGENVARERIDSIDSQAFLRALAWGTPPYGVETLKRYVEDDLRAISSWGPDIVIGDFRLSLYISARIASKPYGAIANAYWSRRYWSGVEAPPVAPLSWLPRGFADPLFRVIYPAAFALHAVPFYRACKQFGIPPTSLDIRDVYTASDATAFADVDAFYERKVFDKYLPPPFTGPLGWEPRECTTLPSFPDGPPIVFISLGSSGTRSALVRLLDEIGRLPLRCIVATGTHQMRLPSNCIFSADFIAYGPACAAAALVICNGGAPAVYSALAQGTPALAVPSNLDQIVNLRSLAWLQAVTSLHNNGLFFSRLASRDSLCSFLDHARERARRAQVMIRQFDPTAGVLHWLRALS